MSNSFDRSVMQNAQNKLEGKSPALIRPMRPADLHDIVHVHLNSFPNFFLTFLGPGFLKLLYHNIARDPDGIVLVADVEGKVAGFVAGVTRQTGFYQRLIQRQKWAFAWAAIGAVVRRPFIVPRLWRALRKAKEAAESAAEACLMSIAVHPDYQVLGVGQKLVDAFCKELSNRGISVFCLTTDRDNNDATNRFYQRLNFKLVRTFVTPEGRAMNEYIRVLREDSGHA